MWSEPRLKSFLFKVNDLLFNNSNLNILLQDGSNGNENKIRNMIENREIPQNFKNESSTAIATKGDTRDLPSEFNNLKFNEMEDKDYLARKTDIKCAVCYNNNKSNLRQELYDDFFICRKCEITVHYVNYITNYLINVGMYALYRYADTSV